MTQEERLKKVKIALNITGDYQNETIQAYIEEVIEFMCDAGVSKEIAESKRALGTIARGVSDLWNYGANNTTYSNYFLQRVIQLSYKTTETTEKSKHFIKEGDENK